MIPTALLHYTDIAFHLAIPVIAEVFNSERRIKESYVYIDLVIIISFGVIFSKNLLIIINRDNKRYFLIINSLFILFYVRKKELKSRKGLLY